MSSVGIIANPASGKDIRRLVAHGSTFDNNEKINIVRRVLVALDALGVERVHAMPDGYGIVQRAAATLTLELEILSLPMPSLGDSGDSLEAAKRLADLGVGAIVTLGGDGTNRIVAKGCRGVPVVPVSTGTNNVFPRMIEGTLAGIAAGLVATERTDRARAVRPHPRLDVLIDGVQCDMALIDVVTSQQAWIGARALWEPSDLREIVISRVSPAEIGMCALGSLLHPAAAETNQGVYVRIGDGSTLLAPIAPGMLRRVPIAASRLLEPGDVIELDASPGTIALDGEREMELLRPGHQLHVALRADGPMVVDVNAAIASAAEMGTFLIPAAN